MNPLCRLTATEAVTRLKRREVSPLELIDAAVERIQETEAQLNSMPTLCVERARERARQLMRRPVLDPPAHYLHGLPIAVKDNTDVEGVRCTSGSRIFADRIAPTSDILVQRLEQNGAVVIGKSNLPEFGAGGNTFNDVFGVTRSPWDTRMTPSGSSGGSAAALASGQVWLATGNDFGGSIRTPSSFCSTVGLRPSPGLVPRNQGQLFSPLAVQGPMARNVADCALMLDCEAGAHPLDWMSYPASTASYADAAAHPQKPGRVAFSIDLGIAPVIHSEVRVVCDAAADMLARDGITVEQAHPDLADAENNFLILRGAIFARMAPLLEQHRELMKPEVIENAEFGLGLKVLDVVTAEFAQGALIRRVASFFDDYDLLVCPAVVCPPFPVDMRYVEELDGVHFQGYMGWLVMTLAISMAACPVLAIPCGFTSGGLPIGLQVVGPMRSEAKLFAYGAYLEHLFGIADRVPIDPLVR